MLQPRRPLKKPGQPARLSWVPSQPNTLEGMEGGSFASLSGKAAGTRSPKKLTPKSNTSLCISFHRLMSKISPGVKGREYALMLTLMCCNVYRAIIAHPGAIRAKEYLILILTALLKGKAEPLTKTLTFLKVFFFT